MQPIRRQAVSVARRRAKQFPSSLLRQQNRRYAHDAHDSTGQHPPQPSTESLGRGFYITIAALPFSFALYRFTRQGTDEQPYFTRLINSYSDYKQRWLERNDLHTRMIERAAHDRLLFTNSSNNRHVDLKFPEIFNTGSPWNVPAGQGGANLEELIAKYEKEAFEAEEKKHQALKDGTIRREMPYTPPAGLKNHPSA
ncbi:hypothetical protein LTR66_002743 [Elasticomyces elasticus]